MTFFIVHIKRQAHFWKLHKNIIRKMYHNIHLLKFLRIVKQIRSDCSKTKAGLCSYLNIPYNNLLIVNFQLERMIR